MWWSIAAVIISLLGLLLGWWKMAKFESNCIATLKSDVANLKKQDDLFREDLKEIFKQLKEVGERLSHIEGQFNGK